MTALADRLIIPLDRALRAVFVAPAASRPMPRGAVDDGGAMSKAERRHAAGLMRVDHVGEVCAQALYVAQAASTRDPALKAVFEDAAREETDHLAWTATRLAELGERPSVLNPLWYAGAYALGWLSRPNARWRSTWPGISSGCPRATATRARWSGPCRTTRRRTPIARWRSERRRCRRRWPPRCAGRRA